MRVAVRWALAAAALGLAWAAFHAWRPPDFVLTRIGAAPPLAPLYAAFAPRAGATLALPLLVLAAALWALPRIPPARVALCLTFALVFAASFRLAVHAVRRAELPGRELAVYAGEAVLYDARRIESPRRFLAEYTQLQPQLSLHGRTKPPGFALLLRGALEVVGRDLERLGTLLTLLGSALVLPAWALGRRVGGAEAGRAAALAVAALPSAVLHGALTLDALFAVVAGAAVVLAAAEAAAPARGRRLGLGLLLAAASLLTYSTALVGLLCGVLLLLAPRGAGRRALGLLEVGLTFALPLALFSLATGFDPLACFANARALNAAAMGTITGRDLASPGVWLYCSLGNALAVALGLGIPVLAGLAALRPAALPPAGRRLALAAAVTAALALGGGVYLLETERILLYLVPVAAALAAPALRASPRATLAVLGVQSIVAESLLNTIW